MICSARLLIIITTMQLGFIPGCLSSVSESSNGLLDGSPTTTPETRTDCENPETGWKIEKLNGRVKSLQEVEINHRYGSGKKELTRVVTFGLNGDYLKDDQRQYSRLIDYGKFEKPTFVFDKDCRVLERRDPKRPDRNDGASRTVFSYAPSGTLKETAAYDSEERLLWKSEATLDKNDRIIETNEAIQEHPEHYKPPRYNVYRYTKSLYKLEDAGNQVEEISYDWKGKLYATYKREYDSARRLIRELRLDHRNRPIILTIYKFTDGGLLQEEWKYDSSGYSDIDELLPGKLDSGFGMFQSGYRVVYEYDRLNNWVKKSEFDLAEKGKLSRVTQRTLIYY